MDTADVVPRPARRPRYAAIRDDLSALIASGAHPVGTYLPSEADLCRTFDTSRFTVREALRRLQDDGLIDTIRGGGSRVIRLQKAHAFVQDYTSVSQLDRFAHETFLTLLDHDEVTPDAETAVLIGASADLPLARFRAVRHAPITGRQDSGALSVVESYLPLRFAPLIPGLMQIRGPLYTRLAAEDGRPTKTAIQATQALVMPDFVADALGVARGGVSLRILRRYETDRGPLISTFNWHHAGDRYIHRTRLPVVDGPGQDGG